MENLLFDSHALMRNRLKAQPHFSPWLFDEVACRVFERLQDIRRPFSRVLDLTPFHTGRMTPFLKDLYPLAKLDTFSSHESEKQLDLSPHAPETFDCILNVLGAHWINHLPQHLQHVRQLLQPDGFFVMALWGGETLKELRQSLYQAELYLDGGVSPRVIPMITLEDGPPLMRQAGFTLPVLDQETWTFFYPNVQALLQHLRRMGETNVLNARSRKPCNRHLFEVAQTYYQETYGKSGAIPATFQLLIFTGWAFSQTQGKALAPGSATHSLADIL
ncbi:MAG: methyltransferase domain-containing protein [Alphaproteobacteria bacterium]